MPSTKPYSEETSKMIDEEVRELVKSALEHTRKLLTEHKMHLDTVAKFLLEREVMNHDDMVALVGKRPFGELHADLIKGKLQKTLDPPAA